ncbi:hypothetical protein D3C78_976110 [compost metagenome]
MQRAPALSLKFLLKLWRTDKRQLLFQQRSEQQVILLRVLRNDADIGAMLGDLSDNLVIQTGYKMDLYLRELLQKFR